MADRAARRRAGLYCHHAKELAENAGRERNESRRRHMLDVMQSYQAAADQLAPTPSRKR
jgi:hypothetical protein